MLHPRSPGWLAEWEPHQATWLSWPHNPETWPGSLTDVQNAFSSIVRVLADVESVHINVNSLEMERQVQRNVRNGISSGRIFVHHFVTDDAWCRDYGACLVRHSRLEKDGHVSRVPALAAVDWEFNCWGNKYPAYESDNRIVARMAEVLGVPRFRPGVVLEGGAIDGNGLGTVLTTESSLLNPNRNRSISRSKLEEILAEYLGVEQCLWLAGGIEGDDTDGHVDDVARFVSPELILAVTDEEPQSANYAVLKENLRRLREARRPDGRPFEICTLPPVPQSMTAGRVLPASYANFYIANDLVLVPVFEGSADAQACSVLRDVLPSREVVPIDCCDIIVGLGAIHCLTQQVPAA